MALVHGFPWVKGALDGGLDPARGFVQRLMIGIGSRPCVLDQRGCDFAPLLRRKASWRGRLEWRAHGVFHLKTLAESWRNAMMKLLRRFAPGEQSSPTLAGSSLTPQVDRDQPSSHRGNARNAALLTALALAACATHPEPVIKTVTVKVAVIQPCVAKDLNLSPTYPDSDDAIRATSGPDDLLTLLAAGRLLRLQTMKEWSAQLKSCQ